MSKIFHKIYLKFYYNTITHTKLMIIFSYSIIIHFILNNKNYHSHHNPRRRIANIL